MTLSARRNSVMMQNLAIALHRMSRAASGIVISVQDNNKDASAFFSEMAEKLKEYTQDPTITRSAKYIANTSKTVSVSAQVAIVLTQGGILLLCYVALRTFSRF
jgi:hypothetical protein